MRRARALWEVFVRRFEEAFGQYQHRRLTGEEAGELLGMSGRQFRRLCVRYEDEGIEGLRDRRIGKASPRRGRQWPMAQTGSACPRSPSGAGGRRPATKTGSREMIRPSFNLRRSGHDRCRRDPAQRVPR
jgi:hypothetical protein